MNSTQVRSPFEVLGLAPSADEGQITAMYRHLAKKHHPDAGGDAERFKEIQWAYEQLRDPANRDSWAQHAQAQHTEAVQDTYAQPHGASASRVADSAPGTDMPPWDGPWPWDMQYMSGAGVPCPPNLPGFAEPAHRDAQGCYKRAWPGLHYVALGVMAASWVFAWTKVAIAYCGASPRALYFTGGPVAYWLWLAVVMALAMPGVAACVRRLWVVALLALSSPLLLLVPLHRYDGWLNIAAALGAAVCAVGAWRLYSYARPWGHPYLLYLPRRAGQFGHPNRGTDAV